jgi:hypothetical protein
MIHVKGGDDANWVLYRKRPVVISAIQLSDDFDVETIEGVMRGHTGDYLIKGVRGELYPCAKEIFEATYDAVE